MKEEGDSKVLNECRKRIEKGLNWKKKGLLRKMSSRKIEVDKKGEEECVEKREEKKERIEEIEVKWSEKRMKRIRIKKIWIEGNIYNIDKK